MLFSETQYSAVETLAPGNSVGGPSEIYGPTNYRPFHDKFVRDLSSELSIADPEWGQPVRLNLGASGGVLLPTCRPFGNQLPGLELAARLALDHQCPLVVVGSRQAKADEFPVDLREKLGPLLTLIDLAEAHSDWLPRLASAADPLSRLKRANDVGPKRNLGIALGTVLGWRHVLFLDDDVSSHALAPTLDSTQLARALGVLQADPELEAIGWSLHDYDDNSVVGHARPFVDLPQGVFIGGGALLVGLGERTPFFPDVYNEDWLFLIAMMTAATSPHRALGWGGRVQQQAYAPFRVRRARSEEAGEVIGEGLMNLFEDHGRDYPAVMNRNYWQRSMESRRHLLQQIKKAAFRQSDDRFKRLGPSGRQELIVAMIAAQSMHREFRPEDLMRFVQHWHADQQRWREHLQRLTAGAAPAPNAALVEVLGLGPYRH